tara:strand:+ start:179 stop:592 length:414 start_codon:yes stop_codon:yes gene_type:complete
MKKDYDYIAAMEKAIAEKYGKNTVQDFRSSWDEKNEKEYLSQLKDRRTLKRKKNLTKETIEIGDVLIKKKSVYKKNERTCPICKTYSFSLRDDLYMNRFKSCHACYVDFIEHREDRWNDGWRPTDEQVAAAIKRRKK